MLAAPRVHCYKQVVLYASLICGMVVLTHCTCRRISSVVIIYLARKRQLSAFFGISYGKTAGRACSGVRDAVFCS